MPKEEQSEIKACWNDIGVWRKGTERCPRLDEEIHCYNCNIFHQASTSVYDQRLPDGYQQEWSKLLSASKTPEISERTSIIVFRIGNEWLALPTRYFKEVAEINVIHRIPHNKNPVIRGFVNVGGEVEVCYSIGSLLDISKQDGSNACNSIQRIMVVEHDCVRLVFPVSEVGSVFRYLHDSITAPPSTVSGLALSCVEGIIQWRSKNVGLLNGALLFESLMEST
jgi:chemotaxis-related protein WspD